MLFVLRSALCIGLVASALPGRAPAWPDGQAGATAAFAQLCRAEPSRCRTLAGAILAAGHTDPSPGARKLRDQPGASPRRLPQAMPVL